VSRVLLAGLALIIAALTFDAPVVLVPGAALVVLGAVIPAWIRLAARGASVTRRLHGDRIEEDQPLEATIEVRRGRLGLPGGQVLDGFTGGTMTLSSARGGVGRDERSTVRVVARFPRRGRRRFEQPVLSLQDPLGLTRVRKAGSGASEELLVLPRTERVGRLADEFGAHPEAPADAAASEAFAATEVDGLRPYRPGAPASRIHWQALARGAGLLERRLRTEAATGPMVVLDARTSGPHELLDAAVRAAASLALELARRSGCELLLPGERRPIRLGGDMAAWPGAHARLALIEGGPDTPAPAFGGRPHPGPVFYVMASRPDQLDRTGLELRMRSVIVVPAELARGLRYRAVFDVAGCRALVVDGRRTAEPVQAA
jgi:uncharacterized protein (DUF58 family)